MMPELRTDSNIDHLDVEKMDKANLRAGNSSSNFQNVAATRAEKSHFNPLPLQCLAAESLPETVKQEIEDITNSSLQEYNLKSTDHQKHLPASFENEHIVTAPLQFFTNSHGLRIVGGIECKYSGEKHAQIVCLKHIQEGNTESISKRPELLTSLHEGLCVTEINGQYLKNTTFEQVKRIMNSTSGPLLQLVVKDCRGLSTHSSSPDGGKRRLPKGKVVQPLHFLTLHKHEATRKTSFQESLEMSIECQLESPIATEHHVIPRKASIQSLDSELGTPTLPEEFHKTPPNGVVKMSLRYLKSQDLLCVNLHKLKHHSKVLASDSSAIFLNTSIFPDKRCQGIKSCKMVSSTVSTESLLDQSASYVLSQEEVEEASIRIIVWDANKSKKPHFRGEVFLKLNNKKMVNLEGVPCWYTICPPDKNLPTVPTPQITHTQETLMQKWANIGTMTLKRIRKGDKLNHLRAAHSSQNLQDLSQSPEQKIKNLEKLSNLPAILKPLKDSSSTGKLSLQERRRSRNDNKGSRLSLYDLANLPQATEFLTRVPSTPNLAGDDSNLVRSMSVYEFLEALNDDAVEKSQQLLSPNTLQVPGQHLLSDDSSRSSGPSSSSSFGVYNGRPTSVVSQTGSDISSFTSSGSESSSITSMNKLKHFQGWSEERLDSPFADHFVSKRHSLVETSQLVRTSSCGNRRNSIPRRRLSSRDGFDHLLPPIPLVSINNEAPHPVYILHSSTETLSPTRKEDFFMDETLIQSLRLSKSTGDLTEPQSNEATTESSLDISGLQRSLARSSKAKDSSLLEVSAASQVSSHKVRVRQGSPSSQPLESIMEQSIDNTGSFTAAPSKQRQRHRSVDDILTSDGSSTKIMPALVAQRKDSSIGTVKKLIEAYSSSKPVGSVNLNLIAKYVSGNISLEVLDVVFFSSKLMNTDYVVKVNLFNRFNEECESSKKNYASIRKSGMHDDKQLPPAFEFSGNPSVYYIQLLFQIRNRVFGRKLYQAFIDLKEDVINSQNSWFYLRKLHLS